MVHGTSNVSTTRPTAMAAHRRVVASAPSLTHLGVRSLTCSAPPCAAPPWRSATGIQAVGDLKSAGRGPQHHADDKDDQEHTDNERECGDVTRMSRLHDAISPCGARTRNPELVTRQHRPPALGPRCAPAPKPCGSAPARSRINRQRRSHRPRSDTQAPPALPLPPGCPSACDHRTSRSGPRRSQAGTPAGDPRRKS